MHDRGNGISIGFVAHCRPTTSDLLPTVDRPQRLSEHVYKALSEAITEGKLPPGKRLRETQIAKALGVSRTPVREAFARLKQQRLLSSDASGAYYVAKWDRKTLWEIATLRAALESLAFSSSDYKRMAQFDFRFHTYIWSRTGHDLLEQALENIKPQAHFYMYLTRQSGQTDYAERHRILIDFLKHGDRSKANEIMLDHILSYTEKSIAWWERRQEEMSEE